MKLHKFEDANLFYTKVKNYLLDDEVLHNLQLGVSNRLINNPDRCKIKPYLAAVEQDGNIIAVVMMTVAHNLLLSKIKDLTAIDIIIQDLQQEKESLMNINAPVIEAQAFAEKWCLSTGKPYQLKEKLRIYKLEKVELLLQAKGNFRLATENDKQLLKSWHDAFCLEALGAIESDSESWVETRLQEGITYFWENEIPVSLASSGRFTLNGAGINTVYTPPEHRKQGYAGACVAALSQTLLDKGYKFCFLFTDLSNPTSNKIYQQIGYKPVADWNNYSFSTSS
ncbi:GNAT family N-acetyltransferase [Plectonema cf. radiosum LEGE 06105]|uniref:GNAT family N-acetyltransferase n=1 Tax=Plectonema cf. radiosum LEGE 06105 TaxID=945769 RepID=A0A8J7F491_9CYAN|nr:GNAT family N-acetyltransferase [Plectonema radiosum]MBE9215818.1 GNAT family N-acetyltransferase [Plectonema cf. radiosum LEGE 06105]